MRCTSKSKSWGPRGRRWALWWDSRVGWDLYMPVRIYMSMCILPLFLIEKVMWVLKVSKARRVTNSNAYPFPFSINEILFIMGPENPVFFFSPLLHPHGLFCTWFFVCCPCHMIRLERHVWPGRSGVEIGWAFAVYQLLCSPSHPRAFILISQPQLENLNINASPLFQEV